MTVSQELIQQARDYLSPQEVDCVIYHSPCNDGFASALAAYEARGDKDVTYIPMAYHSELPEDEKIKGKNILVADFSFDKDTLEKLRCIANKVMILDHHKTAQEKLSGVEGVFLDMAHSGAVLSYEYFNILNKPCPDFYLYIQDRDLWEWVYKEKSKPLHAHIISQTGQGNKDYDFRLLKSLLIESKLDEAITNGNKLLEADHQWVEEKAKLAKKGIFKTSKKSYSISYIALESDKLISELGEYLCNEGKSDFAMLYFKLPDNQYKVSMRSLDEVDVSDIAKSLGGGGHKNAAGFVTDKNPSNLCQKAYTPLLEEERKKLIGSDAKVAPPPTRQSRVTRARKFTI